jgi:hypothetical protein
MTLHIPRLPFSLDPLIAEAKRRMRRRRLFLAVLVLVGAGAVGGIVLLAGSPGSPGTPAATPAPANGLGEGAPPQLGKVLASRCTSVSGGFRACTVYRVGGEVSRIERRRGSGWSVALAPGRAPYPRAPYPHVGYWRRVLSGPGRGMVLAEWSAECEVPFTYLITTRNPSLRAVFPAHPVSALGWTSDGLARVRLLKPIHATKTRVRFASGIYLVATSGDVVRLERPMPPARGC